VLGHKRSLRFMPRCSESRDPAIASVYEFWVNLSQEDEVQLHDLAVHLVPQLSSGLRHYVFLVGDTPVDVLGTGHRRGPTLLPGLWWLRALGTLLPARTWLY
jgi:hypothetical protein